MKSQAYIKALRSQAGLTQKQMADKMKVTQPYISQLEKGEIDISLSKFINIFNTLKIEKLTINPKTNTMKLRSPKNKYMVQMTYGKPIKEIGSSSTFTTDEVNKNHSMIKHHASQAKRNNTDLTVVWSENKETYPKFEWVEIEKYTI